MEAQAGFYTKICLQLTMHDVALLARDQTSTCFCRIFQHQDYSSTTHYQRASLRINSNRKLILTHHATCDVKSVINISDPSTKEPVIRRDNVTSSFSKYRCEFVRDYHHANLFVNRAGINDRMF